MERHDHPVEGVIRELRRRRVGRVAAGYLAVAYAVVEAARAFAPLFEWPDWTFRAVLGAAVLGFPLAAVLAWDFDITPTGIVRTGGGDHGESAPVPRRPRLPVVLFVAFWVVVGLAARFLI